MTCYDNVRRGFWISSDRATPPRQWHGWNGRVRWSFGGGHAIRKRFAANRWEIRIAFFSRKYPFPAFAPLQKRTRGRAPVTPIVPTVKCPLNAISRNIQTTSFRIALLNLTSFSAPSFLALPFCSGFAAPLVYNYRRNVIYDAFYDSSTGTNRLLTHGPNTATTRVCVCVCAEDGRLCVWPVVVHDLPPPPPSS